MNNSYLLANLAGFDITAITYNVEELVNFLLRQISSLHLFSDVLHSSLFFKKSILFQRKIKNKIKK